jgi:hypothetical protein
MSKRQKSKERNYTSARERAEKQNAGFTSTYLKIPEGMELFKPKVGTFLLDIMPFVVGEGNECAKPGADHWEKTYWSHKRVGANGDAYLCPRKAENKPCPICEFRGRLQSKGDDGDEELIKDLAPKQRQLFIVNNLKDPDKKFQLFDISFHLFGKLLDARIRNSDEDDEWDKFFFAEDGLTLRVSFAEKSFGGFTFHEAETIDFKPRRNQYENDIVDEMECLDDLLIVPEYDDLKAIFLEAKVKSKSKSKGKAKDDDDDDEDDDDDDAPPVKKKSSKRKKPPVEDDDDDDDDDAPPVKKKKSAPKDDDDWDKFDDDDDDDDTPPVKKKSSKKKKPVDDDDDDDDDDAPPVKKKKSKAKDDDDWDDDDDDDTPPVKKKSSKKKKPPVDDDDDDDDDDQDDPPAKKKKSTKKKKPPVDDDDDDWDDDED